MRTVPARNSVISEVELEQMLGRAAEEGAKRALAGVGLHDDRAASDLRDLRTLLEGWRDVRRTAMRTIVHALTTGLLGLLVIGGAYQMWWRGPK